MKIARSISHNLLTSIITLGCLGACAYSKEPAASLTEASSHTNKTPPVFLVHGANLLPSSFDQVAENLTHRGFKIKKPALYSPEEETDLETAAKRLCFALKKQDKPAVVVGHSQGGAIISEASAHCPSKIQTLIYLAAVIPMPGEGVFDKLSKDDISNFEKCAVLQDETYFVPISPRGCRGAFMNQLTSDFKAARYYERDFVKEHVSLGGSKANYDFDKLNAISKSYIKTENDLILSPATQEIYMEGHSFENVISLNADHTPFYSQPDKLSEVLESLILD
jgi:pimeloyl-ACP methyl ester carboxylesterase